MLQPPVFTPARPIAGPVRFGASTTPVLAPQDEKTLNALMKGYRYGKPLAAMAEPGSGFRTFQYQQYVFLKNMDYRQYPGQPTYGTCEELVNHLLLNLPKPLFDRYEIKCVDGKLKDHLGQEGANHVFVAMWRKPFYPLFTPGKSMPPGVAIIDPSFQRVVQGPPTTEYSFRQFVSLDSGDLFNHERFRNIFSGLQFCFTFEDKIITVGRPLGFTKDIAPFLKEDGAIYLRFAKPDWYSPQVEIQLLKSDHPNAPINEWKDWKRHIPAQHPLARFVQRIETDLRTPTAALKDYQFVSRIERHAPLQKVTALLYQH